MHKVILTLAFIVLLGELSSGILLCIKLASSEGELILKISFIVGVIVFTLWVISWSAYIMDKTLF
ncbi:hypothetical protein LACR_2140 [Lactococcus cremoris subsp. cremoris SK11]|uniref:Uncharacterized protein n=1 Tax=Lactococcus lactis subsp. cremoris (strain SK11) TaxID=272622 RepID=Q02WQ8_LACLS|nr:hypothetical protein LACR_2140 [Lactococcus cremoris subsp. cremoris SK11]MCT4408271.1 hypothetical protein [Lactococcus cremoris]MCT4421906.1 hypothetical protein [Lactococcus cremoris]MCT4423144.1 hypothetical protein [Lactococcus cremoris]MCT4425552.1 hypothetical protein [Lactococcus cremoris]